MRNTLSKLKWFWLSTVVLTLIAHQAFAQDLINGTVTDAETGEPLIGVTIGVKGTNVGTVSDANGNFTIEAPSDATLVLSFIGLKTLEVPVGSRSVIDVSMGHKGRSRCAGRAPGRRRTSSTSMRTTSRRK
jgi:hypothetical protein